MMAKVLMGLIIVGMILGVASAYENVGVVGVGKMVNDKFGVAGVGGASTYEDFGKSGVDFSKVRYTKVGYAGTGKWVNPGFGVTGSYDKVGYVGITKESRYANVGVMGISYFVHYPNVGVLGVFK